MRSGEICIFYVTIGNDEYAVRCECYEGYDGKVAFGNCIAKADGEKYAEIYHTGHGEKVDSIDKARKFVPETLEMIERIRSDIK